VPYLRLTADRRGVENTFLVHVAAPGEPPRVLYWYRTAPGLKLGRPALDDGAMRTLEAQFPDIDFDWPYILEMSAMTPVEVEAPLPPRRRKPRRSDDDEGSDETPRAASPAAEPTEQTAVGVDDVTAPHDAPPAIEGFDLLADLLGRGIAASMRARHHQLRVAFDGREWADPAGRQAVADRLAAIDPDRWATAEAVLEGMARIEAEVEGLRQALD